LVEGGQFTEAIMKKIFVSFVFVLGLICTSYSHASFEEGEERGISPEQAITSSSFVVQYDADSKELTIVTCPNCPLCAKVNPWLDEAKTAKRITIQPFALLPPNLPVGVHILCAEDPVEEFQKVIKLVNSYFSAEQEVKQLGLLPYLSNEYGFAPQSCERGEMQIRRLREAITNHGSSCREECLCLREN
jgi:hypothetical protein